MSTAIECHARVVGLGTPFGDDRAGWDAIAQMCGVLPAGSQAHTTSDPLFVLDTPPECQILVIIDACRGAGPPGSVHRFEWPDPRLPTGGAASSHGVGLAEALALAAALGRLPPRVVVFAVEGTVGAPGGGITPGVEAAVPELVARALAELTGAVTEGSMSDAVTPELLKGLAFLAPANDVELRALAPAAAMERHPGGAVLFSEGEQLPHIFVVTAGTVALEVTGRDHRPRRFQTVGPGELLGWSPLLGPEPMTATARALTDVTVVKLDAKALLALCDTDPKFGFNFMKRTAAAIAARLAATRLQLLDVYGFELPAAPAGGGL